MNGAFSDVESQHLSANERMHYWELGLCSAPTLADVERFLECEKEDHQRTRDLLEEANENVISAQEETEILRRELQGLRAVVDRMRTELQKVLEIV